MQIWKLEYQPVQIDFYNSLFANQVHTIDLEVKAEVILLISLLTFLMKYFIDEFDIMAHESINDILLNDLFPSINNQNW